MSVEIRLPRVTYDFNGRKLTPMEHAVVQARLWQQRQAALQTVSDAYGVIVGLLSRYSDAQLHRIYKKAGLV